METIEKQIKQANYVLNTIRINSIYNEQLPMIFKLKVFINGLVYKQDVEKALSAIHLFNNTY
ncbi:hypothetical protein DY052_07600 [Apilactobacillus timberlakei]|uniref:hypothetical protein n=1 Tax=Apilactobacillus timberlakei TaxID=2008380 RepID=UPI0011269EAC|nr:hypothetical protein [Apilactobacillus timberlakei]TPR13718.1 hypothetical protein DY052_07600 [Apilactobacillus timberlakei]